MRRTHATDRWAALAVLGTIMASAALTALLVALVLPGATFPGVLPYAMVGALGFSLYSTLVELSTRVGYETRPR